MMVKHLLMLLVTLVGFLWALHFLSDTEYPNGTFADSALSEMPYVSVSPGKVDPAAENKVVFLQGPIEGSEKFSDPDFQVSGEGLMLLRTVERLTYTGSNARETWIKIDQAEPSEGPFFCNDTIAKAMHIGAYKLTPELLQAEGARQCWKDVPIKDLDKIPASKFAKLTDAGSGVCYVDEKTPQMRQAKFAIFPNLGEVSILAKQVNGALVPINGDAVLMAGKQSIDEMRKAAREGESGTNLLVRFFVFVILMTCSSSFLDAVAEMRGKKLGSHQFGLALAFSISGIAAMVFVHEQAWMLTTMFVAPTLVYFVKVMK